MTKLELAICEAENNSEIGNKNDQKSTVHKSHAIFLPFLDMNLDDNDLN